MKKILLCLKKGIMIDIVFLAIGLLVGILIAHYAFHDTVSFHFRYTDTVEVDTKAIISDEAIKKTKEVTKSWYTGSKLSVTDGKTTYQMVELSGLTIEGDNQNGYVITVNKSSFNVSGSNKEYSDAVARGFLKHLVLMSIDQAKVDEYNTNYTYTNSKGNEVLGITTIFDNDFYNQNSVDASGNLLKTEIETKAMLIAGAIGLGVGLILGITFCLIFIGKYDMEVVHEYDNDEIYRTPFHLSYFKKSLESFKSVKSLVTIALLLGLVMISKFLRIPSGFSDLGIGFGYLFLAIACMMFGPIPSLVIGALSDVIGYLIMPDGTFFIGYTFQAMLACFTYGMCFYKTHITFSRVLLARVVVNFICNVIIGSLCRAFVFGLSNEAMMTYMIGISLPKNLVYLLPQSLLLYFVLKAVTVPMSAMNLINPQIAENISFF